MFTKEEKEQVQYFKFSLHPLNELEKFLNPRFLPIVEQKDRNVTDYSINIPNHIVLFWHEMIPPVEVQKSIEKIQTCNLNYQVHLFNERSAGDFIQQYYGQDLYRLYEKRCVHPSMKSDLFRMCYLAKKGGIYIDVDIDCYNSLEEIFRFCSFDCFLFYSKGHPCCIDNDFIVCQPKHPIILAIIEKIKDNLTIERSFSSVWECTGPGVVSTVILEFLMQKVISDDVKNSPLNTLMLGYHDLAKSAYCHEEMEYKKTSVGNWRYFRLPRQLYRL